MKIARTLLFLGTYLFIFNFTTFASPVDRATAQQIATNFWTSVAPGLSARWADITPDTDFHEFYLFKNTEGKGFVIIAADNCVQPVLGYSTTNEARTPLPDHILFFLQEYEREIAFHKSQQTPATETIEQLWSSLLQGNYAALATTSVAPLLTTTWDQSPYYNNLCPDSAGTHAVAGCVATSVAQLMKYWNWPVTGNGSHNYTDATFGPLSADFGSTTYDWTNMPNALNFGSTATQVNAVATLIYHIGVAVEMQYGINGSAATLNSYGFPFLACGENALKNYFRYKGSLHGVYKSQTSDANWISTLTTEIDAGRPVLERGDGDGGGHAFVCDGYDNNGMFHINWGWSGYMDGYFAHNALNPGAGGTGGNNGYNFSSNIAVIVGIEPNGLLTCYPHSLTFEQEGGSTSFLITPNNANASNWLASCNEPWLTITPTSGNPSTGSVTVTATAAPNNTGGIRTAVITITQGTQTASIQVVQNECAVSDQCTVTLQMNDTYGDGWNGASLSVSSASGYTYGTFTCTEGSTAQTFDVCPSELLITWNTGSYDQECAFILYNNSGDTLLNIANNPSGIYTIAQPCDTTQPQGPFTVTVVSNSSVMGSATGGGVFEDGTSTTLQATANSGYRFTGWSDGNTQNPRPVTVTANILYTALFDNLGDYERHYDNGEMANSIGAGTTVYWGVRFPSGTLSPYDSITAIRLWDNEPGNYELRIHQGGTSSPENIIVSQTCQLYGSGDWREIELDTAVFIDHTQPLWVTFSTNGVAHPATGSHYAGNPDGSWLSSNGSYWGSARDFGFDLTWMIRILLSNTVEPPQQYSVTVLSADNNMGYATGGGTYDFGTEVRIEAIPRQNHIFTQWNDGDTNNPRDIIVLNDITFIAEFQSTIGIDDLAFPQVHVYSHDRQIVVENAEGINVEIIDLTGRIIACKTQNLHSRNVFEVSSSGLYFVRLGNRTVKKVVIR